MTHKDKSKLTDAERESLRLEAQSHLDFSEKLQNRFEQIVDNNILGGEKTFTPGWDTGETAPPTLFALYQTLLNVYKEDLVPKAIESGNKDELDTLLREMEECQMLRDTIPPVFEQNYTLMAAEKEASLNEKNTH